MNNRLIAGMLALPFAVSTAFAADIPAVKISGFGTGALTFTDTSKAEFSRPQQASGVKKNPSTGIDSNLGLQASTQVNPWLSATVQGLVRKDVEEGFGGELAWAFVKAKVSDEFSVRIGRIGLPAFMISDYRNVGYANTMVRPPSDMYSQVPIDSIDGVDGIFQHSLGDTTLTAQLVYGKTTRKLNASGAIVHFEFKDMVGLNLVAEHGPLTVRAGHLQGKATVTDSASLNTLLGGLRATGAGYGFTQLAPLANALSIDDKKASFTSLGLILDHNNFLVQSEIGKRETDSYLHDTTSWYVMGGYRFGKFLPYVSHSQLKSDGGVTNTVPASCPAGFPAACTPTLAALSGGVNRVSFQGEQSTNTFGVRWDFHSSAALKVQIDRVKPKNGPGLLLQPAPGFTGPVTVGAVAVDFVF